MVSRVKEGDGGYDGGDVRRLLFFVNSSMWPFEQKTS